MKFYTKLSAIASLVILMIIEPDVEASGKTPGMWTYQELIESAGANASLETLRATVTGVIGREFRYHNTEIMPLRFLSNAQTACKDRARNFKEEGDRQQDSNKKIQYYRGAIRLMAKAIELETINDGRLNPDLSFITENEQIKENYKIYQGNNEDPLPLSNAKTFANKDRLTVMDAIFIVDYSGHTPPGHSGAFPHSEGKDDNYWFEVPAAIPKHVRASATSFLHRPPFWPTWPTFWGSPSKDELIAYLQIDDTMDVPEEIQFVCGYDYPEKVMHSIDMSNYPSSINPNKCRKTYQVSRTTLKNKWSIEARKMKECEVVSTGAIRSMAKAVLISMLATRQISQKTGAGDIKTFNGQTTEDEAEKKLGEFAKKMKSCKVK